MKKIAAIILFIFSANFLFAAEPLFEQANNFYAAEKYEEAILLYDSIQQNGLQSEELFYNMGNAYYKLQNWPNCILYYEKALKLDANHEDALHNLELVQLKIVDKINPIPSLFFEKWMDNLTLMLPFESYAILSLILLWTALTLFTLRKVANINLSNRIFILLLIFSAFAFVFANNQFKHKTMQKSAIIFSSSAVIKSAPSFSANDLFSLHAGSKVVITDQIGNWIHIKIANGNKGWMLKEDCKEI